MDKKYKMRLIVMIIALILSLSLVLFVGTIKDTDSRVTSITFDNTIVMEGSSIVGHLVDMNGNGIANKLITYHKPGYEMGTLVTAKTDENGTFIIKNVEYLSDAGEDNYYGDFYFAGDDKYEACNYKANITISEYRPCTD